jgi:hypothetical protein
MDTDNTPEKQPTAKKEKYLALRSRAASAPSLDELAVVLGETVATMKLYSASAPTKPCLDLLQEILERLTNHHEYPCADESRESFSSVVSRAVSTPVKNLAAQVDAQHRAIQNLSKSVESLKNAPVLSASPSTSPSYAKVVMSTTPKLKPPPLPNPSDERILVRFDGPVPPIFHLPYHQIIGELNAFLTLLGLPILAYAQKQSESSLFIIPHSKEGVAALTGRWNEWAPGILPGGRIAPVATHCFLQVDGIPFASASSLEDLKKEFEERNPALGSVVGTPTWVNRPPSEAKIAAMAAAGRKPPKAGSLFIRLESRELVDHAVATGHVVLAGMAPAVGRGFPHLRVVQCWGCYRFGHTRARCSVTAARCGGCGKDAHGAVCAEKPSCVNCGGLHRSDSLSCLSRKRIAEQLRQRAADVCRSLDEQSSVQRVSVYASPLSPLSSSLGLADLSQSTPSPLAPRLPDHL